MAREPFENSYLWKKANQLADRAQRVANQLSSDNLPAISDNIRYDSDHILINIEKSTLEKSLKEHILCLKECMTNGLRLKKELHSAFIKQQLAENSYQEVEDKLNHVLISLSQYVHQLHYLNNISNQEMAYSHRLLVSNDLSVDISQAATPFKKKCLKDVIAFVDREQQG